jgi:hypothetical protein
MNFKCSVTLVTEKNALLLAISWVWCGCHWVQRIWIPAV